MEFGRKRETTHKPTEGNVTTDQGSSPKMDKWDILPEVPKQTEMGFLHLSFEYHKESLRVRVWQISDLLLPLVSQISMIHSIFVRAYFIPDKARKTLRHTEDVVLDMPESSGGMETPKTGIQHIFTPSSFKFRTPLLYRAVTEAVVTQRSLQLEVCMRQKRSQRTFLMAMAHLPLRSAVRRPIRQKYPLIPCMNVTIPNNMRVYSAAHLELESSKGSDSPSIRRVASPPPAPEPPVPVTARGVEVEVEEVVSLSGEDFLRCHLALCLDEDSDSEGADQREGTGLREVTVTNGVGSGGSSTTTLNMPSSAEDEEEDNVSDDDDVPTVVTDNRGLGASTPIDMSGVETSETANAKKKIIPNELLKADQDVTVEMPPEETVVTIDCPPPPDAPHNTSPSVPVPGTTHTRRKIKPAGPENDIVIHTQSHTVHIADQNSPQQSDSPRGNVTSQQNHHDSPTTRKKKIMVLPGEISIPVEQKSGGSKSMSSRVSSASSEGRSPENRRGPKFSPSQDSAFSPASRPETPCWDFYDWSEDLQMEEGGLEGGGTVLEDSLAQLAQQGLGSVQHSVSKEPILPMDLADDFDSLTVDGEQIERL